ncbi:MAG: metallophosphoesterase [Desulfuromonas sp.]|nr:metallophosphoesterase [Desulfuromonas sp.]
MTFYLIAVSIYLLCYLYIRFWMYRLLCDTPRRRTFVGVMDLTTLALPIVQFSDQWLPAALVSLLQTIGYSWAAIVMCFFPLALLAEPLHWLIKKYAPPRWLLSGPQALAVTSVLCVLMLSAGYWNARHPQLYTLKLSVPSRLTNPAPITLVAISDLHAGKLVSRDWVADIVARINNQRPDLILLLGDILDDHNAVASGAVEALGQLRAPLGVVAILGNHEHYLNPDWSAQQLAQLNFTVLQDEALVINDSLLIAGRRDISAQRFGATRLPLAEILHRQAELPLIVLDHNPRHLLEAEQAGALLQLSGHTHNGQLFPFNLITGLIYDVSWGSLKRGNTLYYVSSGVGVWGPPLRTSSVAEIVRIELEFVNKE